MNRSKSVTEAFNDIKITWESDRENHVNKQGKLIHLNTEIEQVNNGHNQQLYIPVMQGSLAQSVISSGGTMRSAIKNYSVNADSESSESSATFSFIKVAHNLGLVSHPDLHARRMQQHLFVQNHMSHQVNRKPISQGLIKASKPNQVSQDFTKAV